MISAILAGRVAPDTELFRGLRNWSKLFPSLTPGTVAVDGGLLATTVDRRVAAAEFAVGRQPLLMRLRLRDRSPGAWVAGVGDPRLRYQGELLMPRKAALLIAGPADYSAGIPVVDVEVWW